MSLKHVFYNLMLPGTNATLELLLKMRCNLRAGFPPSFSVVFPSSIRGTRKTQLPATCFKRMGNCQNWVCPKNPDYLPSWLPGRSRGRKYECHTPVRWEGTETYNTLGTPARPLGGDQQATGGWPVLPKLNTCPLCITQNFSIRYRCRCKG